jgi:rRNA maturation endonuclease Nob1
VLGAAFGLVGLIIYGLAPAILVGSTAAWFLRGAVPGLTLGFITWATPIVTAVVFTSAQHGGVALVSSAALWNVAGIMLAFTYPLQRTARWPGHCRRCGCDLRSADAAHCPGCGRLRRRVENPTRKSGVCLRCGYDLTGVPDDRCPECGEATTQPHRPPDRTQPPPP